MEIALRTILGAGGLVAMIWAYQRALPVVTQLSPKAGKIALRSSVGIGVLAMVFAVLGGSIVMVIMVTIFGVAGPWSMTRGIGGTGGGSSMDRLHRRFQQNPEIEQKMRAKGQLHLYDRWLQRQAARGDSSSGESGAE